MNTPDPLLEAFKEADRLLGNALTAYVCRDWLTGDWYATTEEGTRTKHESRYVLTMTERGRVSRAG